MRSVLSQKSKKGQLGSLGNILLEILFVVIIVGVVYIVGAKFLGTFDDNASNEYNQTKAAFDTADTVVDFLPLIVIVALAALILFLVRRFGNSGASA